MRKSLGVVAAIGAVTIGGIGGAAFAGSGSTNGGSEPGAISARDLGGAQAPNARLAVLADDTGVIRSHGVAGMGHPQIGIYCVRPKASKNIDVNRMIPSVSVDWDNSSGDNLLAQWSSGGSDCKAGRIEVRTFADSSSTGSFAPSDNVAFTLVVP